MSDRANETVRRMIEASGNYGIDLYEWVGVHATLVKVIDTALAEAKAERDDEWRKALGLHDERPPGIDTLLSLVSDTPEHAGEFIKAQMAVEVEEGRAAGLEEAAELVESDGEYPLGTRIRELAKKGE